MKNKKRNTYIKKIKVKQDLVQEYINLLKIDINLRIRKSYLYILIY